MSCSPFPFHNKMQFAGLLFLLLCATVFSHLVLFAAAAALLPHSEVEALKEIGQKLGKKDWDFSVDPCSGKSGWAKAITINEENVVSCNCSYADNSVCHVVSIKLNAQNLTGVLPPELVKLPYLQQINLVRNCLQGSIPKEWGSLPLEEIALSGNRLSGNIPVEIANNLAVKNFSVEFNHMSGVLPPELGNWINIERLLISSNNFTGPLPETLANLTNLKHFWINDNNFSGKIPNFVQKWTNLEKIMMQASGLEGPIPLAFSLLTKVSDMRISDLKGQESTFPFPPLDNMKYMETLILRSCNIIGNIPEYIGKMTNLRKLDLTFNNLTGQIPNSLDSPRSADFIYLTGNALTGPVPEWMQNGKSCIDLSYNNFTLEGSVPPDCPVRNPCLNLFKSSSMGNTTDGVVLCPKSSHCSNYLSSFHINCGGAQSFVDENKTYEDDADANGASTFSQAQYYNWAFSSTGKFMDSGSNIYIAKNTSGLTMKDYELYMNARLSPISLTYYGSCLLNGNYTVNLHFAEIMFTNDNTYNSLGRRIFDIYIQGKLVIKDFNIAGEAGGVGTAVVKTFPAIVTSTTLEIRFYWAGKGTQGVPDRGTYGPLVSAISVDRDLEHGKKQSPAILVAIVLLVLSVVVMVLGVLWWKGCFGRRNEVDKDLIGLDPNTSSFTLRQIIAATDNFDSRNKIGEGGFGPVYKGHLSDGTIIAVKQLSSKSKQGNREFVNEIGTISALQHPNLVKLYGCCMEGNQLSLVYEYMENNSLARALFGKEECQLKLDWPTRQKICVGIARALAYLHEESRLKIVHRDIKATNVLLDKDFNAKVSDFGLAKLDEEENTHISTRIAGTLGYMAPEYAMRGYLTDKADVYSFGVVTLEIVSGRTNAISKAKELCEFLLDWALALKEKGDLMELVDPRLESNYNKEEVLRMIDVAFQCTNTSPTLRPTMSSVVNVLEGRPMVNKIISGSSFSIDETKLNATKNHYPLSQDQSTTDSQTQSTIEGPWTCSTSSAPDLYPPSSLLEKQRAESSIR